MAQVFSKVPSYQTTANSNHLGNLPEALHKRQQIAWSKRLCKIVPITPRIDGYE